MQEREKYMMRSMSFTIRANSQCYSMIIYAETAWKVNAKLHIVLLISYIRYT